MFLALQFLGKFFCITDTICSEVCRLVYDSFLSDKDTDPRIAIVNILIIFKGSRVLMDRFAVKHLAIAVVSVLTEHLA